MESTVPFASKCGGWRTSFNRAIFLQQLETVRQLLRLVVLQLTFLAMPSEYGCIFGMSRTTGNIKATEVHLTHMKHVTLAVMCGQEDRPFWFCFFKLEKPHYGIRLPRYSKDDELRIVEQNAKAQITDQVRFADLYANVEFSTTTPLPHHVFEQFFFDRICLVGDSVHKVSILLKASLIPVTNLFAVQPHFWPGRQ